jgi:hypothetical protein
MPGFIEGQDRHQVTLLLESLDEFIAEENAVRVVDAFSSTNSISQSSDSEAFRPRRRAAWCRTSRPSPSAGARRRP